MKAAAHDAPYMPLPLDEGELERLRFRAHRDMPSFGQGPSRRRRLGQSLDFREHRSYIPGDDVRTIDWRASLRQRRDGDYLVRSFEAEEQFTLLVVADTRPEMALPQDARALLIACWIVEALGVLAQREKLRLMLLPLFKSAVASSRASLRGQRAAAAAFAGAMWAAQPADGDEPGWREHPDLADDAILRLLQPAAAVVIVTDGTFEDNDGRFGALLARAQRGYRQVAVALLNTWPFERRLLERASVRIKGIADHDERPGRYDPTVAELDAAQGNLADHRSRLFPRGPGLVCARWDWPEEMAPGQSLQTYFRGRFGAFLDETQIFARSA